jgi:hypothetical protein
VGAHTTLPIIAPFTSKVAKRIQDDIFEELTKGIRILSVEMSESKEGKNTDLS